MLDFCHYNYMVSFLMTIIGNKYMLLGYKYCHQKIN